MSSARWQWDHRLDWWMPPSRDGRSRDDWAAFGVWLERSGYAVRGPSFAPLGVPRAARSLARGSAHPAAGGWLTSPGLGNCGRFYLWLWTAALDGAINLARQAKPPRAKPFSRAPANPPLMEDAVADGRFASWVAGSHLDGAARCFISEALIDGVRSLPSSAGRGHPLARQSSAAAHARTWLGRL